MIKRWIICFLLAGFTGTGIAQTGIESEIPPIHHSRLFSDARPWTRWWWFAAEIKKDDIADNLVWLKNNGFGGVEIAWVYPLNRMKKDTVNYTPRQPWLSPEWSEMVVYAKKCADSLGLGCDFTFGSLWPFGDTRVPREEATRSMTDQDFSVIRGR
jgi:hypothetical protein